MSKPTEEMEIEADNFALELLMPEEAFRAAWTLYPTVKEIADYFAVPQSAVNVRAMKLGLGYEIHD